MGSFKNAVAASVVIMLMAGLLPVAVSGTPSPSLHIGDASAGIGETAQIQITGQGVELLSLKITVSLPEGLSVESVTPSEHASGEAVYAKGENGLTITWYTMSPVAFDGQPVVVLGLKILSGPGPYVLDASHDSRQTLDGSGAEVSLLPISSGTVSVVPSSTAAAATAVGGSTSVGMPFTARVRMTGVSVTDFDVSLNYDTDRLEYVGCTATSALGAGTFVHSEAESSVRFVWFAESCTAMGGDVVFIDFIAKAEGEARMSLTVSANDDSQPVPMEAVGGSIRIVSAGTFPDVPDASVIENDLAGGGDVAYTIITDGESTPSVDRAVLERLSDGQKLTFVVDGTRWVFSGTGNVPSGGSAVMDAVPLRYHGSKTPSADMSEALEKAGVESVYCISFQTEGALPVPLSLRVDTGGVYSQGDRVCVVELGEGGIIKASKGTVSTGVRAGASGTEGYKEIVAGEGGTVVMEIGAFKEYAIVQFLASSQDDGGDGKSNTVALIVVAIIVSIAIVSVVMLRMRKNR